MDTVNENAIPMGDTPAAAFSAALKALRERSRSLLRQQADRLRELESRLEQQFTMAVERLEQEPREIGPEEQQLFDRVASLERDLHRLQQLRKESEQALDEARLMLGELEEERRVLRERLDEAEARGTTGEPQQAAAGRPNQDDEEIERLNRRLEMAMQEVRDLKIQNAELAEQAKRPGTAPRVVESNSNLFDWESQKQRLLEQLTSGFDTSDPVQAREKIRCEEVIRTTDRVVAEKDREIAELRRQLAERAAVSAAQSDRAGAEALLSTDEVIKAERTRLAEVQAQWQEKLRHAEVEISIERAKIARERLQLEEKMRLMASQHPAEGSSSAADPKTPNRGRWLSRLGLNNENEKP